MMITGGLSVACNRICHVENSTKVRAKNIFVVHMSSYNPFSEVDVWVFVRQGLSFVTYSSKLQNWEIKIKNRIYSTLLLSDNASGSWRWRPTNLWHLMKVPSLYREIFHPLVPSLQSLALLVVNQANSSPKSAYNREFLSPQQSSITLVQLSGKQISRYLKLVNWSWPPWRHHSTFGRLFKQVVLLPVIYVSHQLYFRKTRISPHPLKKVISFSRQIFTVFLKGLLASLYF